MMERVICGCGEADCGYLQLGYPYCAGCGDHHRSPVTDDPSAPCPVDVNLLALEMTDGLVYPHHIREAERRLRMRSRPMGR